MVVLLRSKRTPPGPARPAETCRVGVRAALLAVRVVQASFLLFFFPLKSGGVSTRDRAYPNRQAQQRELRGVAARRALTMVCFADLAVFRCYFKCLQKNHASHRKVASAGRADTVNRKCVGILKCLSKDPIILRFDDCFERRAFQSFRKLPVCVGVAHQGALPSEKLLRNNGAGFAPV